MSRDNAPADQPIAGPADLPPRFSHWAPSGDPLQAWTTAVDSDGTRWEQPTGGAPWRRLPDDTDTDEY